MSAVLEHEYEPVPGLPQHLPLGEQILWQSKPSFRSLAIGTFHVRMLAAYFAALLALRVVFQAFDGVAVTSILTSVLALSLLAAIAIGLVLIYASRLASATMITITDKRIVVRTGVAVSVTINLPFRIIEAADVRLHEDGSGDIALSIDRRNRASYVLLWPMVKPFGFINVRPVLRGLSDATSVADTLATALGNYSRTDAAKAPLPIERPKPPKLTRAERLERMRVHWPLSAAAALVLATVISVSLVQLMDARNGDGQVEPAVASIDLHFVDQDDGSINVYRASDDALIDTVAPETNGFLRGALRSLVRARRAQEIGSSVPFTVQQTASGRFILYDESTDSLIDLRAFGPTNVEAFARFLEHAESSTTQGVASVASENEE